MMVSGPQRPFRFWLVVLVMIFFIGCSSSGRTFGTQVVGSSDNVVLLQEIEKAKAIIKDANTYCQRVLGYTKFVNYREYKNTEFKYFFRASPKDKLAYAYSFSTIRSEIFDNEEDANKLAEELKDKYDIYIQKLDGHAGGCFISNVFFKIDRPRQIFLVMHEDWHDNVDFSYSLEEGTGTLLGYLATIEILKNNYQDNAAAEWYKKVFEYTLLRSGIIIKYYSLLDDLYKQNVPWPVKERAREEYFKEAEKECLAAAKKCGLNPAKSVFNNATFAAWITYDRYMDIIYRVYLGTGCDLAKTAEIFRGIKPLGEYSAIPEYLMTEEMIKKYEKEQVEYLEKYAVKAK